MILGYCHYHKQELGEEDLKAKNCKLKNKGKHRCKYLQLYNNHPKYRNDHVHISTHKR